MATQLSFPDVIAALGGGAFPGSSLDSFRIMAGEEFFVHPQLRQRDELGKLSESVVLMSARGAAGKSRAAEELSHRLQVPLWKLERDKAVGATSLSFTLGQYLGVADVPSALAGCRAPLVLIDSLR